MLLYLAYKMHKSIQSSSKQSMENEGYSTEQVESSRHPITFWSVRILGVLGITALLTAPWVSVLHKAVIGAYPTIDKEGSLLFFEHGVHHLWLTDSSRSLMETGLPLVGIQVGHLWLTQVFAWFVPTFVAFNIQSIVHICLNVLAVLFWLDSFEKRSYTQRHIQWYEIKSWIVGFIIGAQLHVFRDIHWYTVEKSALFPLFVFWGILHRLRHKEEHRALHSPIALMTVYTLAGLYNFYWAILLPILTLAYVTPTNTKNKQFRQAITGCIAVGLLLGFGQWSLQSAKFQFAEVSAFKIRAGLDIFSISTLDWNRMGFWRPINPLILGIVALMGIQNLRKHQSTTTFHNHQDNQSTIAEAKTHRRLWWCMALFCTLSLGPNLPFEIANPIYKAFQLLPGMWRFAKPEIFLILPYAFVAKQAISSETLFKKQTDYGVWTLIVLVYLCGLYSSPAFPYMTQFIEGTLNTPLISK